MQIRSAATSDWAGSAPVTPPESSPLLETSLPVAMHRAESIFETLEPGTGSTNLLCWVTDGGMKARWRGERGISYGFASLAKVIAEYRSTGVAPPDPSVGIMVSLADENKDAFTEQRWSKVG